MDHGRHQAQDTARPLELHQGRPVGIQAVEDLRMDRVGRFQSPFVLPLSATRREGVAGVGPVGLGECPARQGARIDPVGCDRLEEAATHDLETLVRRGRLPVLGNAPHDVADARQCRPAPDTTDLHIIDPLHHLTAHRHGPVRGRKRYKQGARLGGPCRFGQCLGKRELRLERAAHERLLPVAVG